MNFTLNDIKDEDWYSSYEKNSRIVTNKKRGTHENDILDLVIKPKKGKHTSWDDLCFPEVDTKILRDNPDLLYKMAGHSAKKIKIEKMI